MGKNPFHNMAHIESTLVTGQSLERVFTFLNECENHLRFIPRMIELRQTSPGVFSRVGTTLLGRLRYFGISIPVQYEVIEIEPNHRFAMQGEMGPVRFKDGYILKKIDAGTEIKFWLDLMPIGWTKLFSPFLGLIGKVHAWETLRNLKSELAKYEIALYSQ